jgi:hypothetical protein
MKASQLLVNRNAQGDRREDRFPASWRGSPLPFWRRDAGLSVVNREGHRLLVDQAIISMTVHASPRRRPRTVPAPLDEGAMYSPSKLCDHTTPPEYAQETECQKV